MIPNESHLFAIFGPFSPFSFIRPIFCPFLAFGPFPFYTRWLAAQEIMDMTVESVVDGRGDGEKLVDPWTSGCKGQTCLQDILPDFFEFTLFFFPSYFILTKSHNH